MATLGAQFRDRRTPDSKVTLSFTRFQCLRSIAYAAKKRDHKRANELLKELASIEVREMIGIWE